MKDKPSLRFKEFNDKWEEKKLGEITKIISGGTPNTKIKEYWNGSIRWMNSGELNLKKIYEVKGRITGEGLKNSSTKLIPKNCILVGLAGQGKTRGTVAINFVELCTNQSVASILPNYDNFIPLFLYQNLDSRYFELRNLSTGGGGRDGLNLKILSDLTAFFPSLEEQEKIGDFLSTVDSKIEKSEKKLELLREYKKGVMEKIFTQKLRFKDNNGNDYPNWEEKKLGETCKITMGFTPNTKDETLWNGKYKWLSIADLKNNGKYIKNTSKTISERGIKNKKLLEKGTLIMSFKLTLGRLGILKEEMFTNEAIAHLNWYNEMISTEYMYYHLSSIDISIFGKKAIKGITLNLESLNQIQVYLPILEEQEKIANYLSAIDEKLEREEKKIEDLKKFKKGLLQKMFV